MFPDAGRTPLGHAHRMGDETTAVATSEPAVRGWWELSLLAMLYVGYSATRLVASDDVAAAVDRAGALLRTEAWAGVDLERPVNQLFLEHGWLGMLGSYHYATAHYLVTLVAVVVLHRRGGARYLPARRALVAATLVALAVYVVLPVAPPRLSGLGHGDVLALHATAGWWGTDASAPQGLGELTNELAAMPSMHAGWALWVALVVWTWTGSRAWRTLAGAHASVTALVVVGTGNHWMVDVVAGWGLVLASWWALGRGAAAGRRSAVRPGRARPGTASSRTPSGPGRR